MTLDAALRLTEVLLALAFIQQSLEHMRGPRGEKLLSGVRTALCALVIAGVGAPFPLLGLALLGLLAQWPDFYRAFGIDNGHAFRSRDDRPLNLLDDGSALPLFG